MSTNTPRSGLKELETFLHSLKSNNELESNGLIISLDFGNTYSGVGYCFTSDPQTLYTISTWPGFNDPSPKVPTLLKYNSPESYDWGFKVEPTDDHRIECFKSLLYHSLPKPELVNWYQVESELAAFGKSAKDATSDFLMGLYDYAITLIEQSHSRNYLEANEVKFVLSYPVGWPEEARELLFEIARDVRITPIIGIDEVEAAAEHALKSPASIALNLKVNILGPPAGVHCWSPLRIAQIIETSSITKGSMTLNASFEELIKSRIGTAELLILKRTLAYACLLEQFDTVVKRDFSLFSGDTYPYRLLMPGANLTPNFNLRIERDAITLICGHLKEIFQPLVDEIGSLVQRQIAALERRLSAEGRTRNESLKAIFLVGGFGSNRYLKEHISTTFADIRVIQPEDSWTAVSRGALQSALPTSNDPSSNLTFGNRVATKHYGILCSPRWEQKSQPDVRKYWDKWEGTWRCEKIK